MKRKPFSKRIVATIVFSERQPGPHDAHEGVQFQMPAAVYRLFRAEARRQGTNLNTLALFVVGMVAFAPDFDGVTVAAQAPTPTVSTLTTTAPMKQDTSGKWGLRGLLGLAGLGGLLKRPHTAVRTVGRSVIAHANHGMSFVTTG